MVNRIMCASKISIDLCFRKQKIKTKNGSVENVLIKCVENYLSINGK